MVWEYVELIGCMRNVMNTFVQNVDDWTEAVKLNGSFWTYSKCVLLAVQTTSHINEIPDTLVPS